MRVPEVPDVLTQLALEERLALRTAHEDSRPIKRLVPAVHAFKNHRPLQYGRTTTMLPKAPDVSMQNELNTITSTMNELSTRITHLVETEGQEMDGDVYTELVAAERAIGTLLRRLNRVASRVK